MPGKLRRILTVTDSGSYSAIVTNQFCSDTTNIIKVIVNLMPDRILSTPDTTIFCQGKNARLIADSSSGYTIKWQKGGSIMPGKTARLLDVTTSGMYSAIISNSLCIDPTNTLTIIVNPLPLSSISTTDNTTFCQGMSALLNADSLNGYTFKWLKNNIIIPGKTRKFLSATDSGNYSAIVMNQFCPDTSNSILINVHLLPASNIKSLDATVLCSGSNDTLDVDSFTGYTYKWLYYGSLMPGATSSWLNVTIAGDYSVVVSNTFCTDTSKVITITSGTKPPKPVITVFNLKLHSSSKTGNQWYNGLGPITGATDSFFKPVTNGIYFVIVTNSQGCVSDTSNIIIVNTFGIAEEMFDQYLKLYPNPGNGRFVVENNYYGSVKTEIFDITGKIISEFIIPAGGVMSFSNGELNPGIYFLKAGLGGNVAIKKLVVY